MSFKSPSTVIIMFSILISRWQIPPCSCRKKRTFSASLGKVTASGKYVAYSNAATDGSEVARAINLFAVPDSAADQTVAAITRQAEVMGSALTGLDAAGKADLLAAGIVVR